MESIYPELALCGRLNECARTDTVFPPISEVSEGTVSLINNVKKKKHICFLYVQCGYKVWIEWN